MKTKRKIRRSRYEILEARMLLASDLHNQGNPYDVNLDERVSALDALVVINALDQQPNGEAESESGAASPTMMVDTNDDGKISAIDALLIINYLGREGEQVVLDKRVAHVSSLDRLQGGIGDEVTIQAKIDAIFEGVHEIGLYRVAEIEGERAPAMTTTVDALEARRPLFTANDAAGQIREAEFSGGETLGLYLVAEETPQQDQLRISQESDGTWHIEWEEHLTVWPGLPTVGDRGYDDGSMTLTSFLSLSNLPPLFLSTPNESGVVGGEYVYDSLAEDPDNDVVSYSVVAGPDGLEIDPSSGEITWIPEAEHVGSHSIVIRAEDEPGLADIQEYDLKISELPSNRPPIFTSEPKRLATLGQIDGEEEIAVDLRTWEAFTFPGTAGGEGAGQWNVSADGSFVEQAINADATVFLSDFNVESASIEGGFRVVDTGQGRGDGRLDDDFIGFVFAHQDEGKFYLFDWKASSQTEGGVLGRRGMSVKVVDVKSPYSLRDFWRTDGDGDRVTTLYRNDIGWRNFTDYRFRLDFQPGEFLITVMQGDSVLETIEIEDSTYTSGKFGFYNFSQGQVQYQRFSQRAITSSRYFYDVDAIDPDGDSLQYELVDGPDEIQVNATTGFMSWVPTEADLGNHPVSVRVTDGRGGEATQNYILCVHSDPRNNPPVIVSDPLTSYLPSHAIEAATDNVTPQEIALSDNIADTTVSITLPDNSVASNVDVFLLFDDTGSFSSSAPIVTQEFQNVIADLQRDLPDVDFAFGVGRFEDFQFSGARPTPSDRPFILNQPIIRASEPGFDDAIIAALEREAPGCRAGVRACDLPESTLEGIFQTATGVGFDGNGDGDLLDSGPAGAITTQTQPGSSGDVPPFSSFAADPDNNVLPAAGTRGGVGFRSDALPIILVATDDGTAYQPGSETEITNRDGVSLPVGLLTDRGRGSTPGGRGATFQETVDALNDLGALVIGLGTNADANSAPRQTLESLSLLTDAVNRSGNSIDSGIDADPIEEDEALYFQVQAGSADILSTGIQSAIRSAVGDTAIDIDLVLQSDSISLDNQTGVAAGVQPSDTASFDISLSSTDPVSASGTLNFVRRGTSTILGSIPVGEVRPYMYDVEAVDPDNDQLRFSLIEHSDRMTIDSETGLIEWIPVDAPATTVVTIAVTDGRGGRDEQSFVIEQEQFGTGEIHGIKFNDQVGNGASRTTSITDGEFESTAWEFTVNTFPQDSTQQGKVTRQTTGGNDGAFREVTHTINVGEFIFTDHLFLGETYDPSLGGSVESIDFSIDLRHFNGGSTSIQLLIEQDGNRFYTIPYDGFSGLDWETFSLDQVKSDWFDTNPNVGENSPGEVPTGIQPDFSSQGGPMRFGFALGNTAFGFGTSITSVTGADNWIVTINPTGLGLEGWTVYLDQNQNGRRDSEERFTNTDANGNYAFTGLPEDTYYVREEPQLGWEQTFPGTSGSSAGDGFADLVLDYFAAGKSTKTNVEEPFGRNAGGNAPEPVDPSVVLGPPPPSPIVGGNSTTDWLSLPTDSYVTLGFVDETIIDGDGNDIFIRSLDPNDSAGESADVFVSSDLENFVLLGRAPQGGNVGLDLSTINFTEPVKAVRVVGIDERGSSPGFDLVSVEVLPGSVGPGDGSYVVALADGQTIEGIDFGNRRIEGFVLDSPVFTSTPREDAFSGQLYRYDALAISDNLPLTYSLPLAPIGMSVHESTGTVVWNPRLDDVGTHQVLLRVDDSNGLSALHEFQVTVGPPNELPQFTSESPSAVGVGQTLSYAASAVDPDGDSSNITYRVGASSPANLVVDSENGIVTWVVPTSADNSTTVEIIATDERGGMTTQSFAIDILTGVNRNPEFLSNARTNTAVNVPWIYYPRVKDLGGETTSVILVSGPTGMAFNDSGILEWLPAATGFASVTLQATDARGGSTEQTFELSVGLDVNNNGPNIVEESLPRHASFDSPHAFHLEAIDPDGDFLTWSLLDSPRGMMISQRDGVIHWTPDETQLGPQEVTLEVSDPFGESNRMTFTIDVSCVNASPSIHSSPVTDSAEREIYAYQVEARDPENDPLKFQLTSRPNGMIIDEQTGEITWVPPLGAVGLQHVEVAVVDRRGNVGMQMFDIDVAPLPPGQDPATTTPRNQPPRITTIPVFSAAPDAVYSYLVIANDPELASVTYSLDRGPVGMQIDQTSGLLTWTVGADESEDQPIRISASDDKGATAFQSFTLRVTPNIEPQITSLPLDSVSAGSEYQYRVRVSDPDSSRLSYSVAGPTGMSIAKDGVITWQSDSSDVGSTNPVTVTVSDEHGATDAQAFSLNVTTDTTAPTVEINVVRRLEDNAGNFYLNLDDDTTIQVTAMDDVGVEDLSLTINGQTVPLSPGGIAMFTATNPGTAQLVATATDAAGNSGSSNVVINIIDPNDQTSPRVRITSPLDSDGFSSELFEVGTTVDIIGTVQDDNLVGWTLDYARADQVDLGRFDMPGPQWRTIGTGTTNVTEQVLGVFDATVIANDNYVVRLTASDTGGLINSRGIYLAVVGQAKVGNFRLEFTDLQIPLAGIPVEVTRVYDTLDASISGAFGHGWTMGRADPLILETVPDGAEFIPNVTKVYLTNPDGQRVGFTYTETAVAGGLLGDTTFAISFEPDLGVYDTLAIDQASITRGGLSGIFGAIATELSGSPLMNPSEYTLTTKDGIVYRYHENEGLRSVTDLNGNVLTYSEDGISHSSGVEISFVRDPQGRVDEIHFPGMDNAGNPTIEVLDYQYDANGDLVSFINAADETIRYEYEDDPAHYLSRAINSAGETDFRVVYEFDPTTGVHRFRHVEDANGNVLQLAERPDLASREAVVRDGNGNETTLKFDERGNVLEEIDALGNVTIRKHEDRANPDLETTIIDRRGFVTTREYDDRGNVLFIRVMGHQDDPFDEPIVTGLTYDSGNRVDSITNADNQTTFFDYDANGNLERIVNAVGDNARFAYDRQGRRESFIDFNGNSTTFRYESGDQPSRVTFADGTYQTFRYNQYGQVTEERFYEADGGAPVEQQLTLYDEIGRVTHELDGEFVGDKWNSVRKSYDNKGNLDWEVIVHPESTTNTGIRDEFFGNLIADLNSSKEELIAEGKSRVTDYEYDDRNRLIRQTDAEGGVVRFRYDNEGNRVLLQDPVGNITAWTYDSLNRVVEERDPFYWENVKATDAALAALSNDDLLEMIAPIDPGSLADPLYDDPSGASCESNTGAAHVRLTCYDAEGNQSKTIDRNGRRREFEYDDAGRLLEENWFSSTGNLVDTLSFTYDSLGNMLTAVDLNVTGSDSESRLTFTYDALNRLKTVDNAGTPGAPNLVLTYDYDAQGNVIRVQDNFGVTVESDYDARNRLSVRDWFDADGSGDVDDARAELDYNAAGRIAEMRRFADILGNVDKLIGRTIRTYDLSGRSDLLNHQDSSGGNISSYDYGYDFAGLLTSETRVHQLTQFSQDIVYEYDRTGQLRIANYSGQPDESFTYDANGNRESSSAHGSDYRTEAGNRLTTDGQYTYEYDGEGNLVLKTKLTTDTDGQAGETTEYVYDHRNRLVEVTIRSAGGVILDAVEYQYDALDRRIARTENGETIHYVYNGDNVWVDFNEAGEAVARYLFGNNIDQNIARFRVGEGTVWYLPDRLGSVRDLVNASGQLVNHTEYGAFGGIAMQFDKALIDRFAFTGREFDSTTGNYFYRARFMNPLIGRFTSNDPLGFDAGDNNLFGYLANAPTVGSDPTGLLTLTETTVLTTLIGASVVGAFQTSQCFYDLMGNDDLSALDKTVNLLIAGHFNVFVVPFVLASIVMLFPLSKAGVVAGGAATTGVSIVQIHLSCPTFDFSWPS